MITCLLAYLLDNMDISQSLIDIDASNNLIMNSKLDLSMITDKDRKIKVVSIIGKARGGKSTFLNCLLTHLKDTTQNIFQTANSDSHCTNGIDIYYISFQTVLFVFLDQ